MLDRLLCSWWFLGPLMIVMTGAPIFLGLRSQRRADDGLTAGRHVVLGLPISIGTLVLFVLLSLRCGAQDITTADAWGAIFDYDVSVAAQNVVRDFRIDRTILGLVAGACLAAAGAITQGVTRNPLGSPGILGVNAGAAFAIVTAIFFGGFVSPSEYVWFAFAGAAGAGVLVYSVARIGSGGVTPIKLALAGAVVTSLLGAWTTTLLLIDESSLDEARYWLAGSLTGRDLSELRLVFPVAAAGLIGGTLLGRHINAMNLGEDVASGLGVHTTRIRNLSGLAVVVLAGASVSMAGPIGFIGLAAPHLVRAVVGSDYRWVIPYSALLGSALLLAADVLGRVAVRPSELQVGIVSAAAGAPFLIWLARFTKLSEL